MKKITSKLGLVSRLFTRFGLIKNIVAGSIMFHVRRRPADCAPRKRKKKPLGGVRGDQRGDIPFLLELGPDGQAPHPADTNKTVRLVNDVMEVSFSL